MVKFFGTVAVPMSRARQVLLAAALVTLAGCGGGGAPNNDGDFDGEVRGAMAAIGGFRSADRLWKEARVLKREADIAAAIGRDRYARNLRLLMEANIDRATAILAGVDFKRYSRKANQAAQRRVEGRGLVAEGCEQVQGEWRC